MSSASRGSEPTAAWTTRKRASRRAKRTPASRTGEPAWSLQAAKRRERASPSVSSRRLLSPSTAQTPEPAGPAKFARRSSAPSSDARISATRASISVASRPSHVVETLLGARRAVAIRSVASRSLPLSTIAWIPDRCPAPKTFASRPVLTARTSGPPPMPASRRTRSTFETSRRAETAGAFSKEVTLRRSGSLGVRTGVTRSRPRLAHADAELRSETAPITSGDGRAS